LEWKNSVTSFNSLKIIYWKDRFDMILKGEIPRPVSVTVDATNTCNLHCQFCTNAAFVKENEKSVSEEELLFLADALAKLGVVSVHFSGAGEGLLHPSAGRFLRKLKDNGLDVGLVTNGLFIDRFFDDILYSCKWVGVSVDAANSETFSKLKHADEMNFFKIINNIQMFMRERKEKRPMITFKFLVHPLNYEEIYEAVVLAKSMNVDEVQIRPCYSKSIYWHPSMIQAIIEGGRRAVELSTSKFHVNFITHRYNSEFIRNKYERCEITPLAGLTFAADGMVYICSDLRYTEQGLLCTWREIEQVYGSEKHKELLKNLDVKKCPSQCKDSVYQGILESVFREDTMMYKFI
jgi:MoaA/NifB/PqqE/SkfB family radical SAM enzyme